MIHKLVSAVRCYGVAAALALGVVLGASQVQAQTTPVEDAIAAAALDVEGLAELAATNTSSMLTTVASYGIVLLIVGAAIAFVWKFFTAGRSRC